MANSQAQQSVPSEVPALQRTEIAYEYWVQQGREQSKLSKTKIAKEYGIKSRTFINRCNGLRPKSEAYIHLQRLLPGEENSSKKLALLLRTWGWPPRIDQVRQLATGLLEAKGNYAPLGKNWIGKFMKRYPELQTAFIAPLDKERAIAQDPQILTNWFSTFTAARQQHSIPWENIYNMDEKGFLMSYIQKVKVVIPRHERSYMTQPGNREWVSLIECISTEGRKLQPWVIFKGKQPQKAWFNCKYKGHISVTENGWTNNYIGRKWLEDCFEPETKSHISTGQYRMLIVDGHASHVTTAAIKFCIEKKIVLICLPAHTTHLLQPLDVGVFSPLATIHKRHVQERSRFAASYSIDKVDFLEIYQISREEAITPHNIASAWAKSGLKPFQPSLIL